jgi:hypothetical protein
MKQKLAGMPDAQRKQVEAMMGSHGLGEQKAAVAAELTYEKAGDPRKVGEWDCTPYRIVIGGKPTSDLCVAKLADVGLSRDDLKPFVSLGAFAAKLRGAMGGLGASMAALDLSSMTKALGFDGFPVETSSQYREGHRIVTTLVSVEHQDAPAGAFDVPADYKKREMPDLGSLLAPK